MSDSKHYNYGFVHAMSASLPIIKSIVDSVGQEYESEETVDVFAEIFKIVQEMSVKIARDLTLDSNSVRHRTLFLTIFKNNAELVSYYMEHGGYDLNNKEAMLNDIAKKLQENVDIWHQQPYIESASGSSHDDLLKLQTSGYKNVCSIAIAVTKYPGVRKTDETIKSICTYVRDIVEEFMSDYSSDMDDQISAIVQNNITVLVGELISNEWERYVRDYYRSGINPDRSRVKYMLNTLSNSIEKNSMGVKDSNEFVDSLIDIIFRIATEITGDHQGGSVEYMDMLERYLISRCCIISSWLWDTISRQSEDRINNNDDITEDQKNKMKSGDIPSITPREFGQELLHDIKNRMSKEDYSVDLDDFFEITRQIIISYIGIAELIYSKEA